LKPVSPSIRLAAPWIGIKVGLIIKSNIAKESMILFGANAMLAVRRNLKEQNSFNS